MANNSQTCMSAARDSGFQQRTKYFMQKAATAVLGEANGGVGEPSANEHTARVAYAKLVLDGTASVYEYTVGVAVNSTVAAAIVSGGHTSVTDSDLEYTVNSLFSDYSGWDQ